MGTHSRTRAPQISVQFSALGHRRFQGTWTQLRTQFRTHSNLGTVQVRVLSYRGTLQEDTVQDTPDLRAHTAQTDSQEHLLSLGRNIRPFAFAERSYPLAAA